MKISHPFITRHPPGTLGCSNYSLNMELISVKKPRSVQESCTSLLKVIACIVSPTSQCATKSR